MSLFKGDMSGNKSEDDDKEIITEWPITDCQSEIKSEQKPTKHKVHHVGSENLTKRSKYDKKESLANTALAKWWRHHQFKLENADVVQGCNPNTLIKMISRLLPAREFMTEEIGRLQNKLRACLPTGDVHAALGTFQEKIGNVEKAVYHLQEAIKLEPEEKEYKWLLQKTKKVLRVKQVQQENLHRIKKGATFPLSTQVTKISAKDLTVKDFICKYESTGTPVIITDQKVTTVPWSMDHVKEKAGNCSVTLKKPVKQSVEWARLENSKTVSVESYINSVQQETLDEPLYLFDWSLPINCQSLAKEVIIPKYFAGDFLKRTSDGSLYKDSWPSLFVAPAGITSELHVDAFGSNFWMALFQGKKRWLFFPKSDVPYLYPEYEHSLDPVFEVDLSEPDLDKHPLVHLVSPIECILEPGQVLFVPAGCPHRVENLEPSLAISSNFVDQSNFLEVKNELEVNALLDVRSEDLLHQFAGINFNDRIDFDIEDQMLSELEKYIIYTK